MSTELGQLRFLPWLRRGLGAAAGEPSGGRRTIAVTLNVRRDDSSAAVTKTLRLYGPGDVVQLNPAQVVGSEPRPFANDFEPNYLAAVMFDAPELPWLFSPDANAAAGATGGRVRPWLCLVVVRREVAEIVTDGRRPVPTLRLADASGELPDLQESWAWAHAQLAGTPASVAGAIGAPPKRALSRVVCPRRLRPGIAYIACVVPTFLAGRQAGLGEKVEAGTEPAWTSPASGPMDLPVYHSYEFSTGAGGDFEALVRRLVPRALGPEVGVRSMDISKPGPGLPELEPGSPGSELGLEGALRSPAMQPSEWPDVPRTEFQAKLEAQLEAPSGQAETVVTPPIYGGTHAGAPGVSDVVSPPAWLRELNLDPRHRAAAAFGTQVVQEQQEQLMASAWDQVGELRRANQLLREAQLARAVAGSLREKRLEQLEPHTLLRVTEPVHARTEAPPTTSARGAESLHGSIRASAFPEAAVSPPFRRALRPVGPLGRRIDPSGNARPVRALGERLADADIEMPIEGRLRGSVEFDEVGEQRLDTVRAELPKPNNGWRSVNEYGEAVSSEVASPRPGRESTLPPAGVLAAGPGATAPAPGPLGAPLEVRMPLPPELPVRPRGADWSIDLRARFPDDWGFDEEPGPRRRRLIGINGRFRVASTALQDYLALPVGAVAAAPAGGPLPVDRLAPELAGKGGRLDPEHTVPKAVLSQVERRPDEENERSDPLASAAAAPHFPQPMYEPLRALSQALILPGAEHIPADTVGLLVGNPRFIESYMVGLNHELSRELLWRDLRADLRTTFFDQFWDVRGRDPSAPGPANDIPPVSEWNPASRLGGNATRIGGHAMLVLLVRGELFRRYPTATVYAVKAKDRKTLDTKELYPEFRGTLEPDLVFIAFGLSVAEARGAEDGDAGWFFVIQEQAVEPRFGFDEPANAETGPFGGKPGRWRDLTWGHLVTTKLDFDDFGHVAVEAPANADLKNLTLEGATWGMDATHMAQATLQLPARIAIHASAMLPPHDAHPLRIMAIDRSGDRIQAVGGVDAMGEPWRLSEDEAIAVMRADARSFFVEQPTGDRVDVVIARRHGREYLKTAADGDRPNNLLSLPELVG